MKTIKNIFGVLLALTAMITFYSCGEDEPEYTLADKPTNAQVFFPITNSATIELSSVETSFGIAIARLKTDDELIVPLTLTDGTGLFTAPSSVTFSKGASTATVLITYDPTKFDFDIFTDLSLTIGGDLTTAYGVNTYTFKAGVPAPWNSLGKCTFVEDFMTTNYKVENLAYEVEIQESLLTPGLFRLVNPYGAAYKYNDPGDWDDSKNWYIEIHAEDPTAVYMYIQQTGLNWGKGMVSIGSIAGMNMANGKTLAEQKAAGLTGTYKDGVISFPTRSMIIRNSEGTYYANINGAFRVAMPGVVLKDYSLDVAYMGTYNDSKDKIAGVVAKVTEIGSDLNNVRLAVVQGTDVNAAIEGIRSGNLASVEVSNTENVLVPFDGEPVAGTYTLVAVGYEGTVAQAAAAAQFKYTPPTSPDTWKAYAVGDYEYTLIFSDEDGPAIDSDLTLYRSESNPNRWKIEHWGNNVNFMFTYDPWTGEVLVDEQETGATHTSYGKIFVNDAVRYSGGIGKGQSYFADGVFHFAVVYHVSAGNFGYGEETFTIKENTVAKANKVLFFLNPNRKTSRISTISLVKFPYSNASDYLFDK